MYSNQLAALVCLLFGMISCSTENISNQITHSDLEGHWNITVPSGLMFIEFTPDNRILIGDRGAIGAKDVSQHYFQDYKLTGNDIIAGLPFGCQMEEVLIQGDRMTFVFKNPSTGYSQPYSGERMVSDEDPQTRILNQTWVTTAENGSPIAEESKKLSYFSKTGIFFIKNITDSDLQMYSWEWTGDKELCYTEYQRPVHIPQPECMSFMELTETSTSFSIGKDRFTIQPTTKF